MVEDLHIAMPASAVACRFVRTLMERRLDKWGYSHITDDVLLVATELMTNAIRETPGRPIRVTCRWEPGGIVIEVWDSSPRPPVPACAVELALDTLDVSEDAFDTNGGRGLHIVEALVTEWGHRPGQVDPLTGRPSGKWVWARLNLCRRLTGQCL